MLRPGSLIAAAAALALFSALFYRRQNFKGQIGGAISMAKLLWLDYAILAWLVIPAFLIFSTNVSAAWRRVFTIHLINFGARAVIELILLYVFVAWSPVYGIAHDIFSIALIAWLAPHDGSILYHYSWTIRVGLVCEIVFAALFHRLTSKEHAIYFASREPRFRLINRLTIAVDLAAYTDLGYVVLHA
jgi:hypothetical protein